MKRKRRADDFAETTAQETREVADLLSGDTASQAGCVVYVVGAESEDQGKSVPLGPGGVVIGRSRECQLRLQDDSVSRQHARLTLQDSGVLVEDLGSKNGITYLGKKIERATLQVGARLVLGEVEIDLLPHQDSAALPVSSRECYGDLVGSSLPMRRLYALLEVLEKSEAPVLIEGETGTGKELVARALHENGPRADESFAVVDCGNMPARLMESELFGYRKGAFTGANTDRAGVFESARRGTVFLDELDELPLELQPKLLRVLETNQVKRLGDPKYSPVDVRVIAATKCDLATEVEQGRFRRDLFYRVAVVHLRLPSLRERREDIPALVSHLASQMAAEGSARLPQETIESFMQHGWPGNVRELRNAVQRTLALGLGLAESASPIKGGRSSTDDEPQKYQLARERAIQEFDRVYLSDLMSRHEGNLSAASRTAGISRSYLRELLRKYDLY